MSSVPYHLSTITFSMVSSTSYRMRKGIVSNASLMSVEKPGWGVVGITPSARTRMMKKRMGFWMSVVKGKVLAGRDQWLPATNKPQQKLPSRKNKKTDDLLTGKRQSQEKYWRSCVRPIYYPVSISGQDGGSSKRLP